MEEIIKILMNIQEEMKHQQLKLKDMQQEIPKTINENIDEKFKQIEGKYIILDEKIEGQKTKVEFIEKNMRKKNLVFFGVEEGESGYQELERKILNIIKKQMCINNCETTNIEYVRRLGKVSEKPRPIIVTFTTMGMKVELLRKQKNLNETNYYIKHDYPVDVLIKRRELQAQLKDEIARGKQAFLKHDKIIIKPDSNENKSTRQEPTKKINIKKYLSQNQKASNTHLQPSSSPNTAGPRGRV